jgi:hypothetical protein
MLVRGMRAAGKRPAGGIRALSAKALALGRPKQRAAAGQREAGSALSAGVCRVRRNGGLGAHAQLGTPGRGSLGDRVSRVQAREVLASDMECFRKVR